MAARGVVAMAVVGVPVVGGRAVLVQGARCPVSSRLVAVGVCVGAVSMRPASRCGPRGAAERRSVRPVGSVQLLHNVCHGCVRVCVAVAVCVCEVRMRQVRA